MAEVLEAIAQGEGGVQRRVAVKRLRQSDTLDERTRRMFLDEARLASQLHHPNVVAVLDYGVATGAAFQVLELVDGLDLERLRLLSASRGAPPAPEVALFIAAEIAAALGYAHRARGAEGRALGLVHRDVKPGNVLVGWTGEVKLTDFGIAFARERLERTADGATKGTFHFMAPEQLTGSGVDGRTDVFALGCLLHALVAGRSPLEGAVLADVLQGQAPALDPVLPEDVAAIVRRATQPARADRYADADEMAAALSAALGERVRGDPRVPLRAWLGKLAPAEKPRQSPLDALLQVELVLAEVSGGTRRFETVPLAEVMPPPPPPPAAFPADRAPGRSRSLALVGGLLVLGALGVVAAASGPSAPVRVPPRPSEPRATPAPAQPPPVAVAAPAALTPPPEAAPKVAPKPRRATRHATPATPPPAPAAPAGTGWLSIGGEDSVRAEIRVDGRSHGFAPKLIELAAGAHAVRLVAPGGQVVAERRVQLDHRHTAHAPLRWSVTSGGGAPAAR